MTPERWGKIQELFHAALALEPSERATFLERASAGDEALRGEVESLLASDEQNQALIEAPTLQIQAGQSDEDDGGSPKGLWIGRYRVQRELSRGGMGKVYLAQDTHLGRLVALKLLLDQYTKHDDHLRRFKQEARAVSALNHPNILTVYEVGQAASTHYIATEFIDGATLREYVARSRMELSNALDVAIQVAKALVAAHVKGIVHRDIKPENVMIRRDDGIIKVLDFGLAKLTETQSDKVSSDVPTAPRVKTASGTIIGTVNYMSPEQVRGLDVDGRTDIWSLGVVLYEMVAGRTPFEGTTNSDVIAVILKQEPVPIVWYSPEIPTELQRILMRALRKAKEERYQTVKDFLIDLVDLRQNIENKVKSDQFATTRTGGEAALTEQAYVSTGTVSADLKASHSTKDDLSVRVGWRQVKVAVVAFMLLAALISFGLHKFFSPPLPFQKYVESKLPYTDKAVGVAISPDGKYIAYVANDKGERSIRVAPNDESAGTRSEHLGQIVPPDEDAYYGLTFSHEGKYIYYIRKSEKTSLGTLYRVHIAEQIPVQLIKDIDSPIALSPDGKRLAFIRFNSNESKEELITADAGDGGNEVVLATHKRPGFFRTVRPAWSPDKNFVACAAGNTNVGDLTGVVVVRVSDGNEREITPQAWISIGALAWLPDGRGLLATARSAKTPQQLWHIAFPGGAVRQITAGAGGYRGVSLTQDARTIATVQSITYSNFWSVPGWEASRANKITSGRFGGYDLSLTPGGKILYTSRTSGNADIWIMDPDGKNERQFMNDESDDHSPVSTPDGRYIVFVSNREGISKGDFNIWRMDADGTNYRQLTNMTNADNPHCSPDGRWVIYTASDGSSKGNLWKVPIDGGGPVSLTSQTVSMPVVSPNGNFIACSYWDKERQAERTGIVPSEGGGFVKTFDISWERIRWFYDGGSLALAYVVTAGGVSNVWGQAIDGGPPKRLTDFKSEEILSFDWLQKNNLLVCERGGEINNVVLIMDAARSGFVSGYHSIMWPDSRNQHLRQVRPPRLAPAPTPHGFASWLLTSRS